MVGVVRCWV